MKKIFLLLFLFSLTTISIIFFGLNSHLIKGMIWQPTLDYNTPSGSWEKLGADTLLIQWMHLERKAWIDGLNYPTWKPTPHWNEILTQPWTQNIIYGLSGDFSLKKARKEAVYHKTVSIDLAKSIKKLQIPNAIHGWYAPIEIDPSWNNKKIIQYLQGMPKPLYVSSFVGKYEDPQKYAKWVASWLPADAHLLFQDSVGTGVLTEQEALQYINALIAKFGEKRVGIILEAFTIDKEHKITKAPLHSLARRLLLYNKSHAPIYIFSCRYLSRWNLFLLKMYLFWDSI